MRLLSVLLLLVAGQAVDADVYRFAFDTSADARAAFQCLFSYFSVGIFPVYTNGTINQQGWDNYQAARNVMPPTNLELLVQTDANKAVNDQFNDFWTKVGQNVQQPSIWVDLTDASAWQKDKSKNNEFLKSFLDQAAKKGSAVGVFVNDKSADIADLQLDSNVRVWYQGDSQFNMNDYKPFGGRKYPSIKEYFPNTSACGVALNSNIYIAPYNLNNVRSKPSSLKTAFDRLNKHH